MAEEIESKELIDYTGDIVSEHWEQLGPKELEAVKAPLLYEMLKRKSEFPLHRAIKAQREDVVFLYLIEFNSSLDSRINQKNEQGKTLSHQTKLCSSPFFKKMTPLSEPEFRNGTRSFTSLIWI